MAQPVIQPSFAAGELSPSLYARVDLAKFHVGAALLRNYFVDYRGGVSNRAGTRYVGQCHDSTHPNRLIEFEFSTTQTYGLVFGHLNLQFVTGAGFIINHLTGLPYTLATPYTGAELALLKFTQSADTMTICHPSHAPANLRRLAQDLWTLTAISFVSTVIPPSNVAATPNMTGDGTGYVYQVTAIGSNGLTESLPSAFTGSSTAADSKTMSTTQNAHVTVSWDASPGAVLYNVYRSPEVPGSIAVEGQSFGFIGTSTSVGFIDSNIAPDFSRTPPQDANPFASSNNPECTCYFQQRQVFAASVTGPDTFNMSKTGDFTNFGYSVPSRADDAIVGTITSRQLNKIKHLVPMNSLIAFSSGGAWRIDAGQQGGVVTPSTVEATPQAFNGCSDVPPLSINNDVLYVQAKGSIVRDLAYNYYVNVYTGADMTALSNHLFSGHTILEWAWAEEPFKIVWCVREDGVLLSFTYLKEQDIYAWSHHDTQGLFKSVCSISEGGEDAVYVIVQRELAAGFVQCVERMESRNMNAVPEYNVPADLTRAWFVDCGLSNGRALPNATGRPSALTALPSIYSVSVVDGGAGYTSPTVNVLDSTGTGAEVTATALGGIITAITVVNSGENYTQPTFQIVDATGSGAVLAPRIIRNVTVVVSDIVGASFVVGATLNINNGWGRIVAVQDNTQTMLVTVDVVLPFVTTFPALSGSWWSTPPITTVSGLDHLEGLTVSILADGNVVPQQTVIDGEITLDQAASQVTVGLPYPAQFESLYLDIPGEPATVQGKRKKIPAVTLRVQDSRGMTVGHDFIRMNAFKERDFQIMGNPIFPITGDERIPIDPEWNVGGQLCVQQLDPLPCTILGLLPEVTVGDTRG